MIGADGRPGVKSGGIPGSTSPSIFPGIPTMRHKKLALTLVRMATVLACTRNRRGPVGDGRRLAA